MNGIVNLWRNLNDLKLQKRAILIVYTLITHFNVSLCTLPLQVLQYFGQNTNLLLTECEGRTGEYWPEVVAVRTERSEVRTKMTVGQYSPVRLELARLVSSLLYGTRTMLVLSLQKNTQLMTVSTETVLMAKSRPRKNQSEGSDLPCHIINIFTMYSHTTN